MRDVPRRVSGRKRVREEQPEEGIWCVGCGCHCKGRGGDSSIRPPGCEGLAEHSRVLLNILNPRPSPRGGVERGLPELLRHHLPQALEPLDRVRVLRQPGKLQDLLELLLGVAPDGSGP